MGQGNRGKALILIEGNKTASAHQFIRAARDLGLQPILFARDPSRFEYAATDGIPAERVHTGDSQAVIDACMRLAAEHQIAGITSSSETYYAVAATAARYFALPGPEPRHVTRCQDKFAQRALLEAADIQIPAYRLTTSPTEAVRCAGEIGLPVVLKPVTGVGSAGVRLCRTVQEVDEHAVFLLAGKHGKPSPPMLLVEEFKDGPLCAVHTMGSTVVDIGSIALGAPPQFTLREFSFPGYLTEAEREQVGAVALQSLRALGLAWGPANVEMRLTSQGPVVIEVNPRLAAALDPELIRLASGIDLVKETIKLFTGHEADLRRTRAHAAIAHFLVPEGDGVLAWIDGLEDARAVAGVVDVQIYARAGMRIERRGDFRDVVGHLVASLPGLHETAAALRQSVELIRWAVVPVRQGMSNSEARPAL